MKRNTEEVFQDIEELKGGHIDMVFVEDHIPYLFTYDVNRSIYVFSCYEITPHRMCWIGGKSSEDIIIRLLSDRIDFHDVLLAGDNERMDITWNYDEPAHVIRIPAEQVSDDKLPLHEFMDADPGEFDDEIRELENRSIGAGEYRVGFKKLILPATLAFWYRRSLRVTSSKIPLLPGRKDENVHHTHFKEIIL